MASISFNLIEQACKQRGLKMHLLVEGTRSQLAPYYYIVDRAGRRRYARGVVSDKSNASAFRITNNKLMTDAIAKLAGVPTPATEVYKNQEQANSFLKAWGTIVIKPLDSSHGNGVTTNITRSQQLAAAIEFAQKFSEVILLQQQINGRDVRLLYIGDKLCAAIERKPASVIGDDHHTIRQLIEQINALPERGENYQTKYNQIPLDAAGFFLGERLDGEIPALGQEVIVVGTANVGSGGTTTDITDELPKTLVAYANAIVQELHPGVCGVDFLVNESDAYFLEINASPSFGNHESHKGAPRDVAGIYVDWLIS